MNNGVQLASIFVSNGLGLLLAMQLLLGNNWRFVRNNIEYTYLKYLICMSAAACIIDPIVFWADGHAGKLYWFIVYVGNLVLFIEDIIVGMGGLLIICTHLNGKVPGRQRQLMAALCGAGLLAILINIFVPIIYYVDASSVYHRKLFYWLFTAIEGVFIVDSVGVYIFSKIKGGIFKFFPVVQFMIPIVVGMAAQGAFYGVSLVYPTAMISFAGLLNSLRNEALYMDPLTGLYNRFYLDETAARIDKKGAASGITAFMLDINDFKMVNDKFGHAEGDIALEKTAVILKSTVGALGSVIRYAGDEFVILMNTTQPDIIEGCIKSIDRELLRENRSSGKPYDLSLSIGYCSIDESRHTLDDILSEADRVMYEDKQRYYSEAARNRRSM